MILKRLRFLVFGFLLLVCPAEICVGNTEKFDYLGVTHGQPFDPNDDLFNVVGFSEGGLDDDSERVSLIRYLWENTKLSYQEKKKCFVKLFSHWCYPRSWLEYFLNYKDEQRELEKEQLELL